MSYFTQIVGIGGAFPEGVMTNADFEKFIDTNDEWIRTRTGIKTRHIADRKKGETTMTLSLAAARKALLKANLDPADLDLIIVGTVTPDTIMPCTANMLQAELGAKKAFGFDLQAACSGFVYALGVADQFIRNGSIKHALVIGAETLSSIVDWNDRSTCVLFGDAAGAAVLTRRDDDKHAVLCTKLYSDGTYGSLLNIPHGYTRVPVYSSEYRNDMHKIKMKGGEVFKLAVRSMADAANAVLAEQKLTSKDIDFFIFHQANIRILETCLKTLDVDKSRTWINVDKYGNTSAATLPICLEEAWAAGAVKPGDRILMATFGGGLTWASTLIRL